MLVLMSVLETHPFEASLALVGVANGQLSLAGFGLTSGVLRQNQFIIGLLTCARSEMSFPNFIWCHFTVLRRRQQLVANRADHRDLLSFAGLNLLKTLTFMHLFLKMFFTKHPIARRAFEW